MSRARQPNLTVTLDLEDHRPSPAWPARYPELTRRFLAFFDEHGIRATVFVVGDVAERSPELVREVSDRGHEIGLHSYHHWPVFGDEPHEFGRQVARARRFIEDLVGKPVLGFRAPTGTLLPRSFWATQVLVDAGFEYSASILPAQSPLVGFPGAPGTPFRWPSGLAELPCPAIAAGPLGLPVIGGTLLRVLPFAFERWFVSRLAPTTVPWIYIHPYDIDTRERFWIVPDLRWWGSILVWCNRGQALSKLERLTRGSVGPPLGERLRAMPGQLPVFDPDLVPGATAGARPAPILRAALGPARRRGTTGERRASPAELFSAFVASMVRPAGSDHPRVDPGSGQARSGHRVPDAGEPKAPSVAG